MLLLVKCEVSLLLFIPVGGVISLLLGMVVAGDVGRVLVLSPERSPGGKNPRRDFFRYGGIALYLFFISGKMFP